MSVIACLQQLRKNGIVPYPRQLAACFRFRIRQEAVMAKLRLTLPLFTLAMVASLTLSCGASSLVPTWERSGLQSVTLSPTTADAQDYPDGQVQFTVTAHYNSAPSTVTMQPANWGACYQSAPTNEVSVTTAGLAKCTSGAVGTYTVWTTISPIACSAQTACGGGCTPQANAQLTCP